MKLSRRHLLGSAAVVSLPILGTPTTRARAQPRPLIRIGVLTDMSGPYRDVVGPSSVACVRQAVTDFGLASKNFDVEILVADHQNKPDIGVTVSRQWFDQGVDAVVDVPTSSVALAVSQVAREKDKANLNGSAASVALITKQCSPNTVMWSFDTYMLAHSSGGATVRVGGKSWYFITADYAFGHSLEEQTAQVVREAGGEVLGRVRYPFPDTTDFSSYLAQARASGAQVLGLANAGLDAANCVKQAHEFGLPESGMRIAPLLIFITDIHALGTAVAQGLILTETFYWDLNDRTRAFAARLRPNMPNNGMPTMGAASNYGVVTHYLKTVADMGPVEAKKSGAATVARMKKIPTDDDAFGKGSIREDGRGMFPAYLFQVKTPAESKSPWDLYKLIATTPPDQAIIPLAQGGCPFVHI